MNSKILGIEGLETVVNSRTMIIVCDIDDCFADSRALAPYVPQTKERKDWDDFQKYYNLCTPNKTIIDLVCSTADILPIFFLTSREDRNIARELTRRQIFEFSSGRVTVDTKDSQHRLLMRHDCDYRHSDVVKEEQLISIVKEGFIPVYAIDDNLDNCKMFNKYGITTLLYNIEQDNLQRLQPCN